MKKRDLIVLIIALAAIIIALFLVGPKIIGNATIPFNCVETDGGRDYFIKGDFTYGSTIKGSDYCMGDKLKEYYCENNQLKIEIYTCQDGCEKGACKGAEKEVQELPPEKGIAKTIILIIGVIILAILLFLFLRNKRKKPYKKKK